MLQQAKEFSSLLKNSSGYWKGTFSNIKNSFVPSTKKEKKIDTNPQPYTANNLGKTFS